MIKDFIDIMGKLGRGVKNYQGTGTRKRGYRRVGSGSSCKKPKTGDLDFGPDFWHLVITRKSELAIYIIIIYFNIYIKPVKKIIFLKKLVIGLGTNRN
jgi:hypothetical protein